MFDSRQGLTTAVAAQRLEQYGPNKLQGAQQRALIWQFLVHFRNPLVLVLAALLLAYLLMVEMGKRWFYHRLS